jgi:hypothetical protein
MEFLRLATTLILVAMLLLDVTAVWSFWMYGWPTEAISIPNSSTMTVELRPITLPVIEWVKAVALFGAQPCLAYLVWRLWKSKIAGKS